MKRALITGVTGQDGSYLAELLLENGYRVFGLARHESWYKPNYASHLANKIQILIGDVNEGVDIATSVQEVKPDEIYNLASQSRSGKSWSRSSETLVIIGLAAVRLFESVLHNCPQIRIYHISSSEMFGKSKFTPQDENTLFIPLIPMLQESLFTSNGPNLQRELRYIASGNPFNHEVKEYRYIF